MLENILSRIRFYRLKMLPVRDFPSVEYLYEDRHFGARGYFVDTVGWNKN